jgi:hypothetical protein
MLTFLGLSSGRQLGGTRLGVEADPEQAATSTARPKLFRASSQ